ncbi:hypothetical protein [Flagellimonas sp.]|uniref:hypothetical protein n=1 Tax=Flagellimonas sp. TaxID=2058762 RepID=UPI003BAA2F8F
MSTATAYAPRENSKRFREAKVELVIAHPDDLKETVGYRQTGHGSVPIIKLRKGMIYWLFSEAKGMVEPTPYIISETTDVEEIKEYLDNKMLYIARYPFKD